MNEIDKNRFVRDIGHDGFTVHKEVFDKDKIAELDAFAATLPPQRGHDKHKKWYGWNHVQSLENPLTDVDWGYYWTATVDHPIIDEIKAAMAPSVDQIFGHKNWIWHVQDFIVLQPGMNFKRPHIDTPYRFKEFRYAKEFLGLQFMVMMCDFNEDNGATGYVPGTHKYFYDAIDIRDNPNSWDLFFADNYTQYTAPAGSMVAWHPRLLHSTMPNKTDQVRRALLIHAAEKTTARRLEVIDPQINTVLRKT